MLLLVSGVVMVALPISVISSTFQDQYQVRALLCVFGSNMLIVCAMNANVHICTNA
jgi:putative copper export protein